MRPGLAWPFFVLALLQILVGFYIATADVCMSRDAIEVWPPVLFVSGGILLLVATLSFGKKRD